MAPRSQNCISMQFYEGFECQIHFVCISIAVQPEDGTVMNWGAGEVFG